MKLVQLRDVMTINWNDFYIIIDAQTSTNDDIFEIVPEDFLLFARESVETINEKNLVDALSSAKRAIDCQIDWIISYLGYDFKCFNDKKYPNILSVIKEFESELGVSSNFSLKLRFIQSLGISPVFLISKIREIRNNLEHQYVMPKLEEVKEAIEIAELFINATQNVLFQKFYTDYVIQNDYDKAKKFLSSNRISVSFCPDFLNSYVKLYYYSNGMEKGDIELTSIDDEYIFFIKSAITHDFSYLAKPFGYGPDRTFINYSLKW